MNYKFCFYLFSLNVAAAVLMLGFNDKFKLSDLKSEMYSLPLWKEHDVASHISRIGDYIQIVLLDRGDYTGEISIVANKLQQALLSSKKTDFIIQNMSEW